MAWHYLAACHYVDFIFLPGKKYDYRTRKQHNIEGKRSIVIVIKGKEKIYKLTGWGGKK